MDHHRKMRANSGDSDLHSAFTLDQGKLAKAVTNFIAKSSGLVTVSIDSIKLTPEFRKSLSKALIDTPASKLLMTYILTSPHCVPPIRYQNIQYCQLPDW